MEAKVVNIKNDKNYDVYIGRANKYLGLEGSKWGNPFVLQKESDRFEVVKKYMEYIISDNNLLFSLKELENVTLGCYCYPKLCHGNVLFALLELNNNGTLMEFTVDYWMSDREQKEQLFKNLLKL